jgi:hypothetical protein
MPLPFLLCLTWRGFRRHSARELLVDLFTVFPLVQRAIAMLYDGNNSLHGAAQTQIFLKGVTRWYINVFFAANHICGPLLRRQGITVVWWKLRTTVLRDIYPSLNTIFLLFVYFFCFAFSSFSPSSSSSTDQRSLRPKASEFMGYKSVDGWGFWASEMWVSVGLCSPTFRMNVMYLSSLVEGSLYIWYDSLDRVLAVSRPVAPQDNTET